MQPLTRVFAAVLVLAGGAVHLDLWRNGYEGIPYIGPLFLANVVASGVVAVALLVRANRWTVVASVGLALFSLLALVLSRTTGLLGFMESAWTVDAYRTIAAEIGVIVAVALIVSINRRRRASALVPVPVRVDDHRSR